MNFTKLENKIGYTFKNTSYLEKAMRHSSYANEHRLGHMGCNERLEFLGDSVLGFLTARYLYMTFPHKPEGELTKMRAAHVCEGALCAYAESIGLGEFLLLGKGEEKTNGRGRPSTLADAFEALLAAMYLDGGLEPVEKFLLPIIAEHHLGEDTADYRRLCKNWCKKIRMPLFAMSKTAKVAPTMKRSFRLSFISTANP